MNRRDDFARGLAFNPWVLTTLRACAVTLNANRQVSGVLRGFDQFMNLVLDNAVDDKMKTDIGMVVSRISFAQQVY